MPYTCLHCRAPFPRALRAAGACPHCGTLFETAELVALCIGLTLSFLLVLVFPELLRLIGAGAWHAPSDTTVLVRAVMYAVLVGGGVLALSARYALWQGAALREQPWLRLLWVLALPGALYAGLVLLVGVTFLALRHRQRPHRAFRIFLAAR
jgi:hypothetical protein